MNRNYTTTALLAAASIALLVALHTLVGNLTPYLDWVRASLANGESVCLADASEEAIARALAHSDRLEDDVDVNFVAHQLALRLNEEPIDNLEHLKRNAWKVPQQDVERSRSKWHKNRLAALQQDLELTDEAERLEPGSVATTATVNAADKGRLTVKVKERTSVAEAKVPDAPAWRRMLPATMSNEGYSGVADVMVRLRRHYLAPDGTAADTLLAWARTDERGIATFEGLADTCSYSVLPVRRGYKYGNAKGTVGTTLAQFRSERGGLLSGGRPDVSFRQQPLGVDLLSSNALRGLKEDRTLIVRTPDAFTTQCRRDVGLIIALWWLVFGVSVLRRRTPDPLLLAAMMLLSGIGVIVMYGVQDPLTATLYGADMATGVKIGVAALVPLQFLDLGRWYTGQCRIAGRAVPFDPIAALTRQQTKGYTFLAMALLLTLLLFPFGQEVGGMRVNLNIGIPIQPSEISKALIIIFMAAYFCQNAGTIIRYSGHTVLLEGKLRFLAVALTGMLSLIVLYVLLQDMGPAMVIIFTFIITYSVIKSRVTVAETTGHAPTSLTDFTLLVIGVATFCVALYIGSLVQLEWICAIVWFVVWGVWGYVRHRRLHESPMLFNAIIAAFVFSGAMHISHVPVLGKIADRLAARAAMSSNTWGCDGLAANVITPTANSQVADGLWALATGGMTGQGLANGDAGFVPAYHTDMILETIGEQTGFVGIALLLILYYIVLTRSLRIGIASRHTFTFFVCMGVAVSMFVQLSIIALGSTGVIPLTGITVPFLSYGKVSMVCHIAVFGLVLAASCTSVATTGKTPHTAVDPVAAYRPATAMLRGTFAIVLLMIAGTFLRYQCIERDKTLIRPLIVNNHDGEPTLRYNPRIALIQNELKMGDITDRNGIVVATSDPSTLSAPHNTRAYSECHLNVDKRRRHARYYPFGEHTFFMVGDFNSRLLFDTHFSYMAESRHLDSLRGYDNRLHDAQQRVIRRRMPAYKSKNACGDRFIADTRVVDNGLSFVMRDYSVLLPYLKEGHKRRPWTDDDHNYDFGKAIHPHDVSLAFDAVLQTHIQQHLQRYVKEQSWNNRLVRVSAVVLDAKSGDLLTSALYPLPDYNRLATAAAEGIAYYTDAPDKVGKQFAAYTDMDLGVSFYTPPGSSAKVMSAMSGLMTAGDAAYSKTYDIADAQRVGLEPTGTVSMYDAIVRSSNCYFINLVNQLNAYDNLYEIYSKAGIGIAGNVPYRWSYDTPSDTWGDSFYSGCSGAVTAYENYRTNYRSLKDKRMAHHTAWQWSWGQGNLSATPLAMARVAATIANGGEMPVTNYLSGHKPEYVAFTGKSTFNYDELRQYMHDESSVHAVIGNPNVGGKTGTAERRHGKLKKNDAWYVCYYDKNGKRYAIAVRVERIASRNYAARVAAPIVRDVILPALRERKYID